MEIVYMGLVEKVFDAVFNAILSPVFKFVANLLETALSWVFDSVLKPLLLNVFQPLYTALLELVVEILGSIIYSIYASFLQVVDAMQSAFNVFAGLENVTNTQTAQEGSLLQILFQLDVVQKAVWMMIMVGFVLLLMFAILGTLRSMADIDGESQRPVSRVLSGVFRGMVRLLLIPAVSLFAVMMAGVILAGINTALGGSESSLARMVFVVSSLDACKSEEYNISSSNQVSGGIGVEDSIRNPYYTGEKSYTDKTQVAKDFNFGKFDYMIGFAGGIFLMLVLGICMFNFISRIFEVIILFLAAPVFASVMPLDDGEKFKAWQDMFVAKLFGGYGTVMAMELYMMLCPSVMNGSIVFGQGSTEANYLIRMIFLLGGAWTVVKAGPGITQLLNYQAGAAEADANRSVVAFGSSAASMVNGAAVSVGRGIGRAFARRGGKADGQSGSQAYKGSGGWRSNKDAALRESDQRIARRLGWETDAAGNRTGRAIGMGNAGSSPGLPGVMSGGPGTGRPGSGPGSAARPELMERKTGGNLAAAAAVSSAQGQNAGISKEKKRPLSEGQESGLTGKAALKTEEQGNRTSEANRPSEEGKESGLPGRIPHEEAEKQGNEMSEANRPSENGNEGGVPERVPLDAEKQGNEMSEANRPSEKENESGVPGRNTAAAAAADAAGKKGAAKNTAKSTAKGKAKAPKVPKPPRQVVSLFGGHVTINRSRGGYYYPGLDFGKKLQIGRNADGTFSGHFLGAGWRVNRDGKVDKVHLPFVRMRRYDDGKLHVTRFRIPLTGVHCKRYESVTRKPDGTVTRTNLAGTGGHGKFYVSESYLGSYKAAYDQDTGKKETLSRLGTHYAKNAQGEYVKTYRSVLGNRIEYEKQADGSYRSVHRVGNLTESNYSYDEAGKKHTVQMSSIGNYKQDAEGNQPYRNRYLFRRENMDEMTGGTGSGGSRQEYRSDGNGLTGGNKKSDEAAAAMEPRQESEPAPQPRRESSSASRQPQEVPVSGMQTESTAAQENVSAAARGTGHPEHSPLHRNSTLSGRDASAAFNEKMNDKKQK